MFNWLRNLLTSPVRDARRPALALESLEAREVPAILGTAGAYGILGIGQTTVSLSGSSSDSGSMAVAAGGSAQLTGSASVTGTLTLDPSASYSHNGNAGVGSQQQACLTQAVNDALAAATTLAQMTPTQTRGVIAGSTVITGNGGQNVINVSGINLGGGSTLTLSGGSNDYFYVNDPGAFSLSGHSSIVLTGGVQASHVIFNVEGAGQGVQFSGNTAAVGTILAPNRDVTLGSQLSGSIIGAENHTISLQGHAQLNAIQFVEPPATGAATLVGNVQFSLFGGDSVGPLCNTTVTLTDGSGNVVGTAITDANGNYVIGQLSAGTYTITVCGQSSTVTITDCQTATDNLTMS